MSISAQWTSCPIDEIDVELSASSGFPSSAAANTPGVYAVGSQAQIRYLLVVEKEGIFKRLCEDEFHLRIGCILITGCGFPDISTRACVAKISAKYPRLIVLGISDYNPYGAALLYTYKASAMQITK